MEELTKQVNGILSASPAVVLSGILVCMGYWLKKVPWLKDWIIPFILPLLGAIFYPFIAEATPKLMTAKFPFMQNVVYGAGMGAAAVWMNQIYRQFVGRKLDSSSSSTDDSKTPLPINKSND